MMKEILGRVHVFQGTEGQTKAGEAFHKREGTVEAKNGTLGGLAEAPLRSQDLCKQRNQPCRHGRRTVTGEDSWCV